MKSVAELGEVVREGYRPGSSLSNASFKAIARTLQATPFDPDDFVHGLYMKSTDLVPDTPEWYKWDVLDQLAEEFI